jgi:thiol-disulfide isomerase/thioredoxin
MRTLLLAVGGCLVAALIGFFTYRQFHAPPGAAQAAAVRSSLPADLRLADLDGREHGFAEWRGKLLLVNFWATWCGPCLKEIPELVKVQDAYAARGFQIVGPAVDDAESVRAVLKPLGINYPVLTSGPEVMLKLMDSLGNGAGGLPFSVLVGADGAILTQQLGEFAPAELRSLIEQHLPG